MAQAIHSVVHTLDQTGDRFKESCLRELAEAAYAYTGGWLTKTDYGHEKPGWMRQEMWESLRDPVAEDMTILQG
jgi:hypothetical protein